MSDISLKVSIGKSKLGGLTKRVRDRIDLAVKKTALDIEADAKTLAPVDTGALRSSIQAEFPSELYAEVNVGVDYGIYQEYGTRDMPAQPFMTPATERRRVPFTQAVQQAIKEGIDGG